ncbi:MAG: hypothetical protein AAFQ42_04485 [Pseudomonadota bacterium]
MPTDLLIDVAEAAALDLDAFEELDAFLATDVDDMVATLTTADPMMWDE